MKGRGIAVATLALALLVAIGAVGAEAADFRVEEVEVEPEPIIAGDTATVNVTVASAAREKIEFTEDSNLSVYLDDQLATESSLLEKPNYTDPPEYFSLPPGGEASWTVNLNERSLGERELRVVLQEPYRVGGRLEEGSSFGSREVEIVNPAVEGFDLWISKYEWGIEPTISVVGGNAYIGNVSFEMSKNGSTVFRESYLLNEGTTVTDRIEREEYFDGNGTYVVDAAFSSRNVSREIAIGGNVSGSRGLEVVDEGVEGPPASSGGSEERDLPSFGSVCAAAAMVEASRRLRAV